MIKGLQLPRGFGLSLSSMAAALLQPEGARIDFSAPAGEPALAAPDSLSWRVFKNPVALLVGGIAAVILELAEPAVRTGVWQHSRFLADPVGRLRRTGMAAMITVYGARSIAEPMIQSVVRMHTGIQGTTPAGEAFCANDRSLLDWVQATASFGFGEAYSHYVSRLRREQLDRLYLEGEPAARLYGARGAPHSAAEMRALFESKRGRLEPSPIVFEFLRIMREAPTLPPAARWLQPTFVRAAVHLIPDWIRERLGLDASFGLRPLEGTVLRLIGGISDRVVLSDSPPALACARLGLSKSYLYDRRFRR